MNALKALHSLITANTLQFREPQNERHKLEKAKIVRFSDEVASPDERIPLFDETNSTRVRATTPVPNAKDQYDYSSITSIPSDTYTTETTTTTTTTTVTNTGTRSNEINSLYNSGTLTGAQSSNNNLQSKLPLGIKKSPSEYPINNISLSTIKPNQLSEIDLPKVIPPSSSSSTSITNILTKNIFGNGIYGHNTGQNHPNTSHIIDYTMEKKLISPLAISQLERRLSDIITSFQNEVMETYKSIQSSSSDSNLNTNQKSNVIELYENNSSKVEKMGINNEEIIEDIIFNNQDEILYSGDECDDKEYNNSKTATQSKEDQIITQTPLVNDIKIDDAFKDKKRIPLSEPLKRQNIRKYDIPKSDTISKTRSKHSNVKRKKQSNIVESMSKMRLSGELKYYRILNLKKKTNFPKDPRVWRNRKENNSFHWLEEKANEGRKK